MRPSTLLPGVLLEIEEITHINMPRFDVDSDRPFSGTKLINSNGNIIGDLQKRHDPPCRMLVPIDVRAHAPDLCPVPADTAAELAQQRHLFVAVKDPLDIVRCRTDIAGAQLVSWCTCVRECRRSGHHFKFAQNVIKLLRPGLAVELVLRQEHRHTHKELLRQLNRHPLPVFDEITVIECSDAQIGKLKVAFRLDVVVKIVKVILFLEPQNDTPLFLTLFKILTQMVVSGKPRYLVIEIVEEQARGDECPVGTVDIDLVNSCLDKCCLDLLGGDHITKLQLGIDLKLTLANPRKPLYRC